MNTKTSNFESQILFIQNFHIKKKYSFIYSFETVVFQKYLFINVYDYLPSIHSNKM